MRTTLMAFLALASTAALAEEPKRDAAKPDKMICRVEPDTGSRLSGTQVCLTREQWAERRRLMREGTEHAQIGHADRPGG